jgi:hypothetical protein
LQLQLRVSQLIQMHLASSNASIRTLNEFYIGCREAGAEAHDSHRETLTCFQICVEKLSRVYGEGQLNLHICMHAYICTFTNTQIREDLKVSLKTIVKDNLDEEFLEFVVDKVMHEADDDHNGFIEFADFSKVTYVCMYDCMCKYVYVRKPVCLYERMHVFTQGYMALADVRR